MYDTHSQERLKDRSDYELWLLRYLSEREGHAKGRGSNGPWTFVNRRPEACSRIALVAGIGDGPAQSILDAIAPLRFTAAYKLLDTIVEWILDENKPGLGWTSIPWRFIDKVKRLHEEATRITLPALLVANPDVSGRILALYENLLDFRHEIVHGCAFRCAGGGLTVTRPSGDTLVLTSAEFAMLVETVLVVIEILIGSRPADTPSVKRLRYSLDVLRRLHNLPPLGQIQPVVWPVYLKVTEERGLFAADLKYLRAQLAKRGIGQEVLLDLRVVGIVGGAPIVCWHFNPDEEPRADTLTLSRLDDVAPQVAVPDPADWDFPEGTEPTA
jgi:hypothetical protein